MIVAEFKGGLGNQMFQYAAAKCLSRQLRTDLKFDTRHYKKADAREFVIRDLFELTEPEITDAELQILLSAGRHPLAILKRKLQPYLPLRFRNKFLETAYTFDPQFFSVSKNTYLEGYWQSEKYFRPVATEIQDIFGKEPPLSLAEKDWLERITSTRSVAIHIRRGDYVTNPKFNAYHGVMPMIYYDEAVRRMEQKFDRLEYFVFSDDQDWVEQEFRLTKYTPVRGQHAAVDLYLMSRCNHMIIANSSFSWWGAWLGDRNDKTVIAPEIWFTDPESNAQTKDLCPSSWIRM